MTHHSTIENLFRSNYRLLFILANRLVHDPETARDIVHDVFAAVLAEGPENVNTAYLANRVRYGCLNHIRSLGVRARFNELYPLEVTDAEGDTLAEDDAACLARIVDGLPEQCRRVVRLRFTDGLKYAEIAERLSISEVAVYKHLRHAIDVLRQKFRDR